MSDFKKQLGRWGEELAAMIYREAGFETVARNYRCSAGEIDLVCTWEDELYIVEVKTRTSNAFGYPEESVTKAKRERLYECAQCFIEESTSKYRSIHVQICSILLINTEVVVTIYTENGEFDHRL